MELSWKTYFFVSLKHKGKIMCLFIGQIVSALQRYFESKVRLCRIMLRWWHDEEPLNAGCGDSNPAHLSFCLCFLKVQSLEVQISNKHSLGAWKSIICLICLLFILILFYFYKILLWKFSNIEQHWMNSTVKTLYILPLTFYYVCLITSLSFYLVLFVPINPSFFMYFKRS